jgi:hypothetical protein
MYCCCLQPTQGIGTIAGDIETCLSHFNDGTGEDVLDTLDMQVPQHKQSILFGGTASFLRNMAHSSMKSADGIHTKDTFVFVGMLLCAILSAISVLEQGWNDMTRNRFRLILHIIIIVTFVVPPELHM